MPQPKRPWRWFGQRCVCLVRQPRSNRGGSEGRRVIVQRVTARSGCNRGSGTAAAHLVGARGLVQAVDAGQMTVLPAAHAQQEANDIAANPSPAAHQDRRLIRVWVAKGHLHSERTTGARGRTSASSSKAPPRTCRPACRPPTPISPKTPFQPSSGCPRIRHPPSVVGRIRRSVGSRPSTVRVDIRW